MGYILNYTYCERCVLLFWQAITFICVNVNNCTAAHLHRSLALFQRKAWEERMSDLQNGVFLRSSSHLAVMEVWEVENMYTLGREMFLLCVWKVLQAFFCVCALVCVALTCQCVSLMCISKYTSVVMLMFWHALNMSSPGPGLSAAGDWPDVNMSLRWPILFFRFGTKSMQTFTEKFCITFNSNILLVG